MPEAKTGNESSETGITKGWEPQCGYWESNLGLLEGAASACNHRAVSWPLNGTPLLNNTSPVTAKAQRTLQKRRQKDHNRWRAGRSLLEITWLWDPWAHRSRDYVPKKCTRSSQLKFEHTWGGALKAPPFTEELLAVNSCLREGEASFFEDVFTERLPML